MRVSLRFSSQCLSVILHEETANCEPVLQGEPFLGRVNLVEKCVACLRLAFPSFGKVSSRLGILRLLGHKRDEFFLVEASVSIGVTLSEPGLVAGHRLGHKIWVRLSFFTLGNSCGLLLLCRVFLPELDALVGQIFELLLKFGAQLDCSKLVSHYFIVSLCRAFLILIDLRMLYALL